ncbi:MAG TPA: ABC transporter permease, partial [Bryobacteraceae bacterium]|nr:ABC transporter permease [Bryobacteraceae bacterium]
MRPIIAFFRNLLHSGRAEHGLDQELRSFIDMSVDQKMAEGMSQQEARRFVQLHLGGIEQCKEAVRDVRWGNTLQQLLQDIRYSARDLRRHSGFAVVAILTFALGIGANTAMFALFDAVLLRTLPVAEPQQLFLLNEVNPREQGPANLSWPALQRLRKSLPSGAQLIALAGPARFNMTSISGEVEPISGQLVSGNYFPVLGIRAAVGRVLNEDDNRDAGVSAVAVLSHAAWVRRFGADSQIVGREISINGAVTTIVGVAEPGFYGVALGALPDVWLPLMLQHQVRYVHNVASHNGDTSKPWPPQENLYWLRAVARVAPPSSEARVVAALGVAFEYEQDLGAKQIGLPRDRRLALESGARGFTDLRSGLAAPLKILLSMVGLLLLVACANIASLVLARGTARRREFAVRLSLGASRSRLLRQLLTENLLLSAIGGLLGVLLAVWAMPVLPRLFSIPVTLDLDYRMLGVAAALSLLTGLTFGAIPAFQATRVDLNPSLKSGPSGPSLGVPRIFGNALVVSQIALSFVLVTGAALLGQSLLNLMRTHLGFDREHIVTAVLDPQSAGISPQRLPALYAQLIHRIKSEPDVRDAAISLSSLAGGGEQSSGIHVPGYVPQPSERPGTKENLISPGYFTIMGMR